MNSQSHPYQVKDPWVLSTEVPERWYSLKGDVRVLLSFDPWQLMFSMTAVRISKRHVVASLSLDKVSKVLSTRDLDMILAEGDPFSLQIDHDLPHLGIPNIDTYLTSKKPLEDRVLFLFTVQEEDGDYLNLLGELEGIDA